LGFIASVTLKNSKGVDILVTNETASKSVAIQVKTNQGDDTKWLLNKKAEMSASPNFFYVFVRLKDKTSQPEFHIVPSTVIAEETKSSHQKWLATPGKRGQKHNDSSMRVFVDSVGKYRGKWDLLGL
jgi:hypothetical protein